MKQILQMFVFICYLDWKLLENRDSVLIIYTEIGKIFRFWGQTGDFLLSLAND